jgi:hypothetical protein
MKTTKVSTGDLEMLLTRMDELEENSESNLTSYDTSRLENARFAISVLKTKVPQFSSHEDIIKEYDTITSTIDEIMSRNQSDGFMIDKR